MANDSPRWEDLKSAKKVFVGGGGGISFSTIWLRGQSLAAHSQLFKTFLQPCLHTISDFKQEVLATRIEHPALSNISSAKAPLNVMLLNESVTIFYSYKTP